MGIFMRSTALGFGYKSIAIEGYYYLDFFGTVMKILTCVKCDHRSKFSNLSNWKGEA